MSLKHSVTINQNFEKATPRIKLKTNSYIGIFEKIEDKSTPSFSLITKEDYNKFIGNTDNNEIGRETIKMIFSYIDGPVVYLKSSIFKTFEKAKQEFKINPSVIFSISDITKEDFSSMIPTLNEMRSIFFLDLKISTTEIEDLKEKRTDFAAEKRISIYTGEVESIFSNKIPLSAFIGVLCCITNEYESISNRILPGITKLLNPYSEKEIRETLNPNNIGAPVFLQGGFRLIGSYTGVKYRDNALYQLQTQRTADYISQNLENYFYELLDKNLGRLFFTKLKQAMDGLFDKLKKDEIIQTGFFEIDKEKTILKNGFLACKIKIAPVTSLEEVVIEQTFSEELLESISKEILIA